MTEEEMQFIAQQLRQPHGEHALQVATKMNQGNKLINQWTIEALDLVGQDRVLEIGMGNGYFVKHLLEVENNLNYVGCDFSPEMITEARKINAKYIQEGKVSFDLGNVDQLPYPDNSFDKVFTINTIYFWEDMYVALSELRRVLKPDGKLVLGLRPKSSMQAYPFVKYGFKMFTTNEIKEILSHTFIKVTIRERDEPSQMINDMEIRVQSLIVSAHKSEN